MEAGLTSRFWTGVEQETGPCTGGMLTMTTVHLATKNGLHTDICIGVHVDPHRIEDVETVICPLDVRISLSAVSILTSHFLIYTWCS